MSGVREAGIGRGLLTGAAVLLVLALALVLAAAAAAAPGQRGSLPRVGSGELPGPPLLYRKPATAPQLKPSKPFRKRPLLVSGTDAYRAGEYLYQDYLYDDYGANTVPGRGTHTPGSDDVAAQTDGDIFYPTAGRYAHNAADIVELRIKRRRHATLYRVTLNTLLDRSVPLVGIGIDTDRRKGGEPVAWPGGAGLSTPGLDTFVRAWGSGGWVSVRAAGAADRSEDEKVEGEGWRSLRLPEGAVRSSLRRNQITIKVPDRLAGRVGRNATHRYVAGAGLHDGDGDFLKVPAREEPDGSTPASGSATSDAPAIFNLAFRFNESHSFPAEPPHDSFPAAGVWFEAEQSHQLAEGGSGPFFADVDFAKLRQKHRQRIHRPRGHTRARIFSSRQRLGEGVEPGSFPKYLGRLQPYLITVPPGYRSDGKRLRRETLSKGHPNRTPRGARRERPVALTFTWHSLGGNYTQYATYSPNQLEQFGVDRTNIVVSPLARGTDGWYHDEAEIDVFEVWADVAHFYKLNPRRTYPTGYSMGGYGTYKLGVEYPDLFARAYTTVGPPGEGIWVPPDDPSSGPETNSNGRLANVRWVPYMNWAEVADELVPYAGVRAQQATFDELGLRGQLWSFAPGEHFTLAILDEWGPAAEFLGRARTIKNPSRVDYVVFPEADRPELGLVHDHAYWVSDVRTRDPAHTGDVNTTVGSISAKSHAFGEGEPPAQAMTPGTVPALNGLNVIEGTEWGRIPKVPKRNALDVTLENLKRATIDGRRARLDPDKRLKITIESDGPGTLVVVLELPRGAAIDGPAKRSRRGLRISYGAGTTEVVVRP